MRTGTEEEGKMKELVDAMATRLLGKDIWREAQESLHALEEKFYAKLVTLARGQGKICHSFTSIGSTKSMMR